MNRIKVAAHVHSEWSHDASWSLPDLARSFRRRGFEAVLMSEHDDGFDAERWQSYRRACAAASLPGLALIPGIEYGDCDNAVHVPVWGDLPFLGSGLGTGALLRRARAEGGFTVFAHPWRRDAWRRFDEDWLADLSAVEIWNRKYDGWAPRADAVAFAQRHALAPFASLDFHTRRQFFPLAMTIEIDGSPTRESVYDGLAAGRFTPTFLGAKAMAFTHGIASNALAAIEAARRLSAEKIRGR
jgi:hypothetical protein